MAIFIKNYAETQKSAEFKKYCLSVHEYPGSSCFLTSTFLARNSLSATGFRNALIVLYGELMHIQIYINKEINIKPTLVIII